MGWIIEHWELIVALAGIAVSIWQAVSKRQWKAVLGSVVEAVNLVKGADPRAAKTVTTQIGKTAADHAVKTMLDAFVTEKESK